LSKSNVVDFEGNTFRDPRVSAMYVSVDEAVHNDREWFSRYPTTARYRLRKSFPGEFPISETGALQEGVEPFTLVTQLVPGVRVSLLTPVPHDVDPTCFKQIHLGVVAHLVGGARYRALVDEYEKHRD